ncbi:hypothetical protein L0244_10445 [bacterium]|nr:hypothetical protein [bacterium]
MRNTIGIGLSTVAAIFIFGLLFLYGLSEFKKPVVTGSETRSDRFITQWT